MNDEPPLSQVKSKRLTPEQIQILDDLEIDFRELVDESIEKKKKKYDAQTKKKKINAMLMNSLFLIIGILFLWTVNFTGNLISIAIIAGIGIVFSLIGGINVYRAFKAEGMIPAIHRK